MQISKRRWRVTVWLMALPLIGWSPPGLNVMDGEAAAQPATRLVVDVSERKMYVYEGGDVARTYPVAVGRPSNPTPRGSFRTGQIIWNPSWNPPNSSWARDARPRAPGDPKNPMQGVKIYFRAPAYYIHGTNDPASIGQAASRGCIRMRVSDAKALARWIQQNGGSVSLRIRN